MGGIIALLVAAQASAERTMPHASLEDTVIFGALLRMPEAIGRARQAPYPRLRALLRTVGDAPQEVDGDRNLRFVVPGPNGPQRLRLDEIPLPATTPAPYPRPSP
ncbi:hypothetical protein ACIPSA_45545 [Streptomyces sp. NPDC086549]|uniref:hypothetical protein n=1 Tax=Streptomyces sp. NPDC086549 TaxID=3365752 RepID=UPI0037FB1A95